MTAFKGTPGPWTAMPFGRSGGDPPTCFRVKGRNGDEVADTADYTAQDEVNVMLIEAAFDLLQVAQSVVYVHEHSGSNAQFVLRGLVDDARTAIAKALGSQVPA